MARPHKTKWQTVGSRPKLRALLSKLARRTERLWRGTRAGRPVHFLHIGKTGGTAFKHAITTARRQNARLGALTPALHLHPHTVHLRDIPKGDRFFFFLRDPISRFVSGFYSRKNQGHPRHFVPGSLPQYYPRPSVYPIIGNYPFAALLQHTSQAIEIGNAAVVVGNRRYLSQLG